MTTTPALVLVTTSFPTEGDGSEAAGSFVADVALAISEHVPVRIVAPGSVRARCRWRGLDVLRFAAGNRPLSTLSLRSPIDIATIAKVLASGSSATCEAVQLAPTRQVLALWTLPSGSWARSAANRVGVPYDVWALGSDIWTLAQIPLVRQYMTGVLTAARWLWADGHQLAADTAEVARRPVEFLPSTRCINVRVQTPVRGQPPYRMLFLGRWHRNKGIDVLMAALDLLQEDDWNRIELLTIAGGGELNDSVRAAAERLRALGRPVSVLGFLAKEDAERELGNCDFVLIPSRIESIPVVFSDAVKMGRPVVSTAVGDLPLLVGQEPACGILSKDVSPTDFAAAMRAALAGNPARYADGARRAARDFDLGKISSTLLYGQAGTEGARAGGPGQGTIG